MIKNGYTLIELIVVIAIIAILALILVPQISGYAGSSSDCKDQANSKTCYTTALALWTGKDSSNVSTIIVDSNCTIYTNDPDNGVSGSDYTTSHDLMPTSSSYGNWIFKSSDSSFTPISVE